MSGIRTPTPLFLAPVARDSGRKIAYFFNSLLSCSLSRDGAQLFVRGSGFVQIFDAHSRRQDAKTPVEQALMRGLGTA